MNNEALEIITLTSESGYPIAAVSKEFIQAYRDQSYPGENGRGPAEVRLMHHMEVVYGKITDDDGFCMVGLVAVCENNRDCGQWLHRRFSCSLITTRDRMIGSSKN